MTREKRFEQFTIDLETLMREHGVTLFVAMCGDLEVWDSEEMGLFFREDLENRLADE